MTVSTSGIGMNVYAASDAQDYVEVATLNSVIKDSLTGATITTYMTASGNSTAAGTIELTGWNFDSSTFPMGSGYRQIVAYSNDGWEFDGWTTDIDGDINYYNKILNDYAFSNFGNDWGTAYDGVSSTISVNRVTGLDASPTFKIWANFNPTITATDGSNGAITYGGVSAGGIAEIEYGKDSEIYTITADAGYVISNVLVDGQSVAQPNTASYQYTFTTVTAPHTITFETAEDVVTPTSGEYLWFGEYQQNEIAEIFTDEGVPDKPQAVIDAENAGQKVFFRDLGNNYQYRWYSIEPVLWKILEIKDNDNDTTTYTALSEYTLAFAQMDANADAENFKDSDLWDNWFVKDFNATAFDEAAFDDQLFIDAGLTQDKWEWFDVSTDLLSYHGAFRSGYFDTNADRITTATDYCLHPILFGNNGGNFTTFQWLSSTMKGWGSDYLNDAITGSGAEGGLAQNKTAGVRPIITLTVDSNYNKLINTGTFQDPY